MRKTVAVLLAALVCCIMFTGCGILPSDEQEQHLTVYSFSGENEQFTVSNGVIVLTSTEEIFYGGNLEEKQEKLSDIVASSMTFYIIYEGEREVLLSNSVMNMTGETINIAGSIGKISGDIIIRTGIDELQNNLYFELKTIDLNGEENEYQLQLTLTEVTGKADN